MTDKNTIELESGLVSELESWGYDSMDKLIREALLALEIKEIMVELRMAKKEFGLAQQSVLQEMARLRALRLGERVSQMEENVWTIKAHMEILANGMNYLLKPWWKRLF